MKKPPQVVRRFPVAAQEVLDRTGNADRDIEGWGHDLARLADLPVVGGIAGVHRGARGTDSGTQCVGQLFDQGEIVFGADTAPAGHDHAGRCQFGAVGFGDLVLDPG